MGKVLEAFYALTKLHEKKISEATEVAWAELADLFCIVNICFNLDKLADIFQNNIIT